MILLLQFINVTVTYLKSIEYVLTFLYFKPNSYVYIHYHIFYYKSSSAMSNDCLPT